MNHKEWAEYENAKDSFLIHSGQLDENVVNDLALKAFIRQEKARSRSEGRNEAVDYIIRIAWEGAAPDTKLVNNSILEDARRDRHPEERE